MATLFTRLGFTAFGGPAAHIAMMRDEVVTRRQWVDDQTFVDLMGATNPANADEGTIRKLFAESVGENTVHGSDSQENAALEIAQFFSGLEIVG